MHTATKPNMLYFTQECDKLIGPDAFHIQTVNSRHSHLKGFLQRYPGVSTKYLDTWLRWFQRVRLDKAPPRAFLAVATDRLCIQFRN